MRGGVPCAKLPEMPRPDYYGNPSGLTGDVDVVRGIYAAFAERDLDAVLEHVHQDCVLYAGGTAALAGHEGPYRGPEGVRRYFEDAASGWDELQLHPDDFRSIPGFVVAFGHAVARRGDASLRRAIVWTWQLRDGKAIMLRVADVGDA
jgi:ketosteroid isomerase-like protein